MHDTVPDYARRFHRSLQTREHKESAEEAVAMRRFLEEQTVAIRQMTLDDRGGHHLRRATSRISSGIRPLPLSTPVAQSSRAVATTSNPNGNGRSFFFRRAPATTGTSEGARSADGSDIIVPESDEEDDDDTSNGSMIDLDESDTFDSVGSHESHVITRLMMEEANMGYQLNKRLGSATSTCTCGTATCRQSSLCKVKALLAKEKAELAAKNAKDEAKKAKAEPKVDKSTLEVPSTFRWVEIEIV